MGDVRPVNDLFAKVSGLDVAAKFGLQKANGDLPPWWPLSTEAALDFLRQQSNLSVIEGTHNGFHILAAPLGQRTRTQSGFPQDIVVLAYGVVDTTRPRHEGHSAEPYAKLYTGTIDMLAGNLNGQRQLAPAIIADIHQRKYPSHLFQ